MMPYCPARDGHPSMFELEDNAGTAAGTTNLPDRSSVDLLLAARVRFPNREIVLQYAARLSGSRVLDDSCQSSFAGIAVGNVWRLAYISEHEAVWLPAASDQQCSDQQCMVSRSCRPEVRTTAEARFQCAFTTPG
jgi:hypothetical protein